MGGQGQGHLRLHQDARRGVGVGGQDWGGGGGGGVGGGGGGGDGREGRGGGRGSRRRWRKSRHLSSLSHRQRVTFLLCLLLALSPSCFISFLLPSLLNFTHEG